MKLVGPRVEDSMKKMTRLALAAGALAMTAMVANAADSDVSKRRALMKDVVKANMGVLGGMIKGKNPYDAGKAKEALGKIGAVPAEFVKLFPEGTGIGGKEKTAAKPEIWKNMDDFKKWATTMTNAAATTAAAADKGKDALAESFRKDLLGSCKGCHEKYKASKPQ